MKQLIALIVTAGLVLAASGGSFAQGIPVYDAAGFTQVISQLEQMAKDYRKQIEQLEQAIKQTSAITGTRTMGGLANGDLEEELRRYLPVTWEETLAMINAGSLSGSAAKTRAIYSDLYSTYKPATGADYIASDPGAPVALSHDRFIETTYAAMAASAQAYNNITKRIETYETLLKELDKTEDLKSSIDLSVRIAAENGMIMNEIMRLNTILMQQQAAADNKQITARHRASLANKYDADKAARAFKQQE